MNCKFPSFTFPFGLDREKLSSTDGVCWMSTKGMPQCWFIALFKRHVRSTSLSSLPQQHVLLSHESSEYFPELVLLNRNKMQELIQLVLDNMKQYQFEWELFIEIHGTASIMILKNISYQVHFLLLNIFIKSVNYTYLPIFFCFLSDGEAFSSDIVVN